MCVQNKNFSRNSKELAKFLEPDRQPKIIHTDNSSEFGKASEDLTSSLNENWWADSMDCFNYLRNVTDLLSDGKAPYGRRFGEPFKGPINPLGSLVEYYPISAKDQSRIHQFGKKVSLGLFLGYALYAGRRVTYLSQTLRSWRR